MKELILKTEITDWLMLFVTIVYVIATIFICIYNARSATASKKQLEESQKQFKEMNRALVTITFEVVRNGLLVLHIQNLGKNIAKNVKICIDSNFIQGLPNENDQENCFLLSKSSFVLGVNQSVYLGLGSHVEFNNFKEKLFKCNITYSDIFNDYNEELCIFLPDYGWELLYQSPINDIYCEIKNDCKNNVVIKNILNNIADNLTK